MFSFGQFCFGQTSSFEKTEKELTNIYSKIFPFYYGNYDSLEYYSNLFSDKLIDFIKNNPSTIDYSFKSFADSNVCRIVTTSDSLFRIYSWDTWQGGTMHDYKNLYQFKSGGKVYTTEFDYGEGDMGTYFTGLYTLKENNKTYFLATSMGSESSKYYYEAIRVYSILNDILSDSIQLIKTSSGLNNSIVIEYDVSSVLKRPERPIRLIKYDNEKRIIYIPIVTEDSMVTDRYILYQFTGQYFEEILTQKKADKNK